MDSPLNGIDSDDPLELTLDMLRYPLPRNVTPVDVDPLKYIEPVAAISPEAIVVSKTVGVLNELIEDGFPSCPKTVK
jgi:hypothetical protein